MKRCPMPARPFRGLRSRRFRAGLGRSLFLCAAVCAAVGLVACKGVTLPATNVSSTGAKLNMHGEADKGPAFSYFEYWQTAVPSLKSKTVVRNWPAGAQGDFGDRANGLRQGTSYTFRACGNDSGKPAVCVNPHSFKTGVSGYSGIAHSYGSCGNSSICVDPVEGSGAPSHDPDRWPGASDPSWSPDATKIAFPRSDHGKLRVWDVASGTSAQLGTETIGGHPDWSPDGTKIAVDNGIIRASDGARLSTADTRDPSWSPDGTKIAYTCDPPGDPVSDEICVGGRPLTNTDLNGESGEPAWSPDGTKIAYTRHPRGNPGNLVPSKIFVMNADGTDQRQLTFDTAGAWPNYDSSPSWSPDGKQIAFEGMEWTFPGGPYSWVVKEVDAGGGKPSVLFEGTDPDWSPRP
jgi:dipeptidyl aminopeptidase/acylaminoacyl peptidase